MMIVICPRCSTPYAIPPDAIGHLGRLVRCSACGHEWQQQLPATTNPAAVPVAPRISPAAPVSPPMQEAAPRPESAPAATPLSSAEPEPSLPSAAPQPGPDIAAPADAPSSPVSEPAQAVDDDTIAFADEEPMQAADETAAPEAPSQPPEPPAAVPAQPKPSRRKHWLVGGIAAGVTLLLLVGGAVALQKSIVAAIPAMEGLFALFAAPPPPPGAGLEIRDVGTLRELRGIHEIIVVSGSVANTTEETRPVPPLRVSLVDAEDATLETTVITAAANTVAGGGSVGFEATLRDPGDQARNLKIAFANPQDQADDAAAPHSEQSDHGSGHGASPPHQADTPKPAAGHAGDGH